MNECRCCLSSFYGNQVMVSDEIISIFFELTSLEVNWSQDSFICTRCDTKLSEFYKFRSEILRLHSLTEPLMLVKIETDEPDDDLMSSALANPVKLEYESNSDNSSDKHSEAFFNPTKFHKTRPKNCRKTENFSCKVCNKIYKNQACLKRHVATVHEEKDPIKPRKPPEQNLCSICAKIVKGGKSHLAKHVLLVHSDDFKFFCDFCPYRTKTRSSIASHMKSHLLEESRDKFVCTLCPASFKEKYRLDGHVFRIHIDAPKIFECDCGKAFKSKKYLNHHQYKVHKVGHFPCDQCPGRVFLTKARLNAHKSDFHAKTQPCETCGKMIAGGRKMTIHTRIHRKPAFKCTVENCSKEFFGKQALQDHISIRHKGLKNFLCPTCSSAFATIKTLRKHVSRQHLAEKIPCKVPGCKYSTTRKDYLSAHYKSHRDIEEETRSSLLAGVKEIQGMGW